MKKLLVAALVAVFSFVSAQAVTLTWDSITTGTVTQLAGTAAAGHTFSEGWSLSVTFAILGGNTGDIYKSTTGGYQAIASVGNVTGSDKKNLRISATNTTPGQSTLNSDSMSSVETPPKGTGFTVGTTYTATMTHVEGATSATLTITYVDADGITQTLADMTATGLTNLDKTITELAFGTASSVEGTNANRTFGEGELRVDSATFSVPEPTVLALLALGVAGLALKRRA